MAKKSSGKAGPAASRSPKSEKAEMRDRLEASGLRRTEKAAQYPAHKSGDALALAEEPPAPAVPVAAPVKARKGNPEESANAAMASELRPARQRAKLWDEMDAPAKRVETRDPQTATRPSALVDSHYVKTNARPDFRRK